MSDKLYDEPSKVDAAKGEVIVDGPDGVAVSLTPEAAAETGARLIDCGLEAAGQRRMKGKHRAGGWETPPSD